MTPLFLVSAALGALGAGVLVFRKRVASLYDRIDMPDQDRATYKTVVVPLAGCVLILCAALLAGAAVTERVAPGVLRDLFMNGEGSGIQRLVGGAMIVLGSFNALSHATGKPRPVKLGAMMHRFGAVPGRALHLLGYTVGPIVFGIWLLSAS